MDVKLILFYFKAIEIFCLFVKIVNFLWVIIVFFYFSVLEVFVIVIFNKFLLEVKKKSIKVVGGSEVVGVMV